MKRAVIDIPRGKERMKIGKTFNEIKFYSRNYILENLFFRNY